jgi:hypothetical protein
MSSEPVDRPSEPDADATSGPSEPSEEELRAAYEAELSRVTSAEVMLQSAVSLLNIASRRLGTGAPPAGADPTGASPVERDLEQVRDAIDGVRALLCVLERRLPNELGPLRDALSQLQIAYAREAQAGAGASSPGVGEAEQAGSAKPDDSTAARGSGSTPAAGEKDSPVAEEGSERPGPAESSGRLWVPGR